LLWWARRLAPAYQAGLWAVVLAGFAVLLRRGWLKLFGPVVVYDLICVGRRGRYVLLRCLYLTILLLVLLWVHSVWSVTYRWRSGGSSDALPAREMALFAESFFYAFMVVQLLVVIALTPAYLAGAIAEEKERRTLEYLLATDLRAREIVLGKLAARLLNLAMLLLAGLPVLSALQFFGGVDPGLVLAGFAALAVTLLSLGGVSILMSVLCRRPRDAIMLTYLLVLAYILISFGLTGLRFIWPEVAATSLVPGTDDLLTVGDLVDAVSAGNVFMALAGLERALIRGLPLGEVLTDTLVRYALFHGVVALLCTVWAVVRLRPTALQEAYGRAKRLPLVVRLVGRVRVGDEPMWWKEVSADAGLRLGWFGRIAVACLVVLSFLPVFFILTELHAWRHHVINQWVRTVGTGVACLMLLAVAVRAAGSISGERDRQTLDALLTTPMSCWTILQAKWAGSVLSVRWAWLWLAGIWTIGLAGDGLTVVAPILVALAWFIYAAVFAAVGLWFSVISRTSLRATVGTILTVVFIGGGHWLVLGMCCMLAVRSDPKPVMQFLAGQTPPVVLGLFAFQIDDFGAHNIMGELAGFAFFGLLCWGGAACALGAIVHNRFVETTGRDETGRLRPHREVKWGSVSGGSTGDGTQR
jgi:ABC-type transport system involved in multi-copper enzyme maturation permease subunit